MPENLLKVLSFLLVLTLFASMIFLGTRTAVVWQVYANAGYCIRALVESATGNKLDQTPETRNPRPFLLFCMISARCFVVGGRSHSGCLFPKTFLIPAKDELFHSFGSGEIICGVSPSGD